MTQEKRAFAAIRLWAKRPGWIVILCPAVATMIGFFLLLKARHAGDIDRQLRAIDAEHAIPESDNAASIYTELAWDSNTPSVEWTLFPQGVLSATLARSWRNDEFPEAAQWLQERRTIIDVLLQATRKPQCWFSVSEARWQTQRRSGTTYKWSILLLQAANHDLGEGRVDAGFEKLLCTLRMANHFLAQDSPHDYQDGMGMGASALKRFGQLVITEDVPKEWLPRLEAALPPPEDASEEKGRRLAEVSSLYEREIRWSIPQRLVRMFNRGSAARAMKRFHLLHVAECRSARILLALRRYKDQTGVWPTDLAAIKPYVSSETIIDPFSGTPFVYRLTGNTFLLYTVGPGGTDEGGRPPKDRILWPR